MAAQLARDGASSMHADAALCALHTPGLHYKIPVFSDPAPGKS